MPTLDLGQVKGDTGTSLRNREAWTANTAYVNNSQYIDIVTNDGNLYMCKTSHTSETTFSDTNWTMVVQKGDKGDKGDIGVTPTIQAGTATILDANASPTVSATTSGDGTTIFNFGIPKGDTSEIEIPTFDDTVITYTTLTNANTAAETTSNAIKSKVNIFTTLSNMKKSFSAIVQGLKILGTNVGAITGITSDLAGESETVAASIKAVNQLNNNLSKITTISVTKGAKFQTGSAFAHVKNGVCYVTIELTPSAAVVNDDIVLTGLPKQNINQNLYLNLPLANGYSYSAAIKLDGKLVIYYPHYTTVERIDTYFSYLINPNEFQS